MIMNFKQKFIDARQKFEKVGIFGIPYLDDTLGGISKTDLILIGARSGAGKTSIASIIAIANKDSNVALFSLENFDGEDILKYSYYEYKKRDCSYRGNIRDFVFNDTAFKVDENLLDQAINSTENKLKHINLFTRKKDYTIEKLKQDMIETVVKNKTKLIIIDHLDYLDKENPNGTDIQHISDVMRVIRDFQDAFDCAIVSLSHLRKSDKRFSGAIPSMDEFIGSSNKIKEATIVITLSPDDEKNLENINSNLKSTWCCIRKLRLGGISNTTSRIYFNTLTGQYSKNYQICSVNFDGTKIKEIKNEKETWQNRY